MNIFVGNLNTSTTEEQLRKLFTQFGKVLSVKLIMDFDSGLSKGFGFVEMNEPNDGNIAIRKLNDTEFMEQTIKVEEATALPVATNDFLVRNRNKEKADTNRKKR